MFFFHRPHKPVRAFTAARRALAADDGMSTAEYAIGTIAAATFGAILYTVISGESVLNGLNALVQRALAVDL